MYSNFPKWAKDSSPLLDEFTCAIPKYCLPKDVLLDTLYSTQINPDLTRNALQEIIRGFIEVTEYQLADFCHMAFMAKLLARNK